MKALQSISGERKEIAASRAPGAYEPSITLKDFLAIVRRRQLGILTTVCVITGLTALVTFQLMPRYTATADVMIKPGQVRVIDLESVVSELPPDRALIETEIQVLRSDFHAQRVVQELELLSDADFNPQISPEIADPTLLAGLTDWLSRNWLITISAAKDRFGTDGLPQPAQNDDVEHPDSDEYDHQMAVAVRQLLKDLNVSQGGDSYIISIGFTSTDPKKAARIANSVAELYVAGQREEKLAATKEAANWLADRVGQLGQRVIESERAIEEYRVKNRIVSGQSGSLSEQDVANLNLQLLTAQAELAAKEARLQRVSEVQSSRGSYGSLAEVMSSPVIIALRQQEAQLLREQGQLSREYGPQHPRMLELAAEKEGLATKIDLEIGNILASLENEVAVSRSRERALAEALEAAKDRSAVTSQAEIQLRQLEREAQANRSLYQAFLTRLKQTEEQLNLVRADAQFVSPAAIPELPSFPKPKLMIAVGFTSSVMMGLLIALLRERLDSAFRTGRQLHEALGIPSFGLVPAIHGGKRQAGPHHYLLEKPLSAYADAIRSVQNVVERSSTDRRAKVVLVTSTLPGEGKTTLALSLAASVARSGRKAIVVDADLRSPSVARVIGQPCGSGLVEFLTGEATSQEVIYVAECQPNLHFVPVKGLTSSPVDLLESRKMSILLAELRTMYDFILLDGPPALVTDARAAALLADTVLYVVQWERTKAEVASHGLEALAGSGIPVTGLVLTQVNLKRHARYGDVGAYYDEYRKYYLD